jgi:hypothetical protein
MDPMNTTSQTADSGGGKTGTTGNYMGSLKTTDQTAPYILKDTISLSNDHTH